MVHPRRFQPVRCQCTPHRRPLFQVSKEWGRWTARVKWSLGGRYSQGCYQERANGGYYAWNRHSTGMDTTSMEAYLVEVHIWVGNLVFCFFWKYGYCFVNYMFCFVVYFSFLSLHSFLVLFFWISLIFLFCWNSLLVRDKSSKRTKVVKVEGWSPMDLLVEWHFSKYNFDMKEVFQENALGMLLM